MEIVIASFSQDKTVKLQSYKIFYIQSTVPSFYVTQSRFHEEKKKTD